MKYYLRLKFPLKSQGDIKDMVSQKQNSYITEDEWRNVITFIYEKQDSQVIEQRMLEISKRSIINAPQDKKKKLNVKKES